MQQNGNRVSLFASGAAWAPDPDQGAGLFILEELGDGLFFQRGKGLGIAKEVGDANQQVAKQRLDLAWRLLQELDIAFQRLDLIDRHAPLDAAVDGAGLVVRKIVPGQSTQQDEDLFEGALGLGRRHAVGLVWFAESMNRIAHLFSRHALGRQLKVHQAGGNRALGHAVVFARVGRLHHCHAALALDGTQSHGAVAAGAREHDANGAFVLVLCQRAKEKVNRQALAARRRGLQQLQRAIQERHVAIGRNDVGAVDLHPHAVADLEHLHAGVAPDQLDQNAFVVGRQVLHQHKGHTRLNVARHAREEGLERGQTTGRGANADNREAGRLWHSACRCWYWFWCRRCRCGSRHRHRGFGNAPDGLGLG